MSYLIECTCGKKLSVLSLKEGERFLCPFCGTAHSGAAASGAVATAGTPPPVSAGAETFVMSDTPQTPSSDTGSSEFPGQDGEVLGQYRVVCMVGKGAMGTVYRAYDESLDRHVAVKFLSCELSAQAGTVERFRREAKAAAALSHPNIVHVYGIGKHDDRDYFVMEYVEGKSLAQLVHEKGKLPASEAVDYLIQAARGLEAATKKGIVHRDVKPSNILLGNDGVVRIADFGLSKLVKGDASMTGTGIVVGTPFYMSPEQGKGHKLDHRADIYSLGATFYHLVTGRPPFDGNTPLEVLLKHATEPVVLPEGIEQELPEGAARVVRKMMAKDRDKRYATYAQLIADLDALKPRPFVFAGVWVRVFALAIDAFIALCAAMLVTLLVTFSFGVPSRLTAIPRQAIIGLGFLPISFFFVFFLMYVLWHSRRGQTPGKMAMRIEVVTTDGRRPSTGACVMRFFSSYPFLILHAALGVFLLLAVIETTAALILASVLEVLTLVSLLLPGLAAFDSRKRGVHDVVAGTYVVYRM
ncbi:MAG: protein kinase [Planctomycetota bacterium]|nr:protein kinase [Planctomycetota bacterium]